jgi:hypothetical protein
MKSIIFFVFVCAFILASGFNAFGEEWTAGQKEVWNAIEKHWEFIKNGNIAATMEIFHDETLVLYGDNPSTLNRSQIESHNKWLIENYVPTYIKLKPIAVNIVNNVANVFFVYKWESKNKEYSQSGRRMTTMVKENNKWLSIGSLSASCDQKAPCPYGW